MPYAIKRGRGERPFNIVDLNTGEIVGTSEARANAEKSIRYRMKAVHDKREQEKYAEQT